MSETEKKAILFSREVLVVASKILGHYGQKDDEAWGAFTGCIAAITKLDELAKSPTP